MACKYHTHLLGGPLGIEKCAFAPPRVHGVSRRGGSHRFVTLAFGSVKKDQSIIQGYVQPGAAPNQLLSSPWYIKAPLAIFGLIAVLRVFKAVASRDRGSVTLPWVSHSPGVVLRAYLWQLNRSCQSPQDCDTLTMMPRSLDTLQGRGLISEERSIANTDPFYDSAFMLSSEACYYC